MSLQTRTGRGVSNPGTCALTASGAPLRPLDPRAAFLLAHDRLALLAGIAPARAFVVAAVDWRGQVVASLFLEDGGAVVIGRHMQCGIRLPADVVSLRHAAVLVRWEDGAPRVRVWDLRTGIPFLTEDQRESGAVSADGPLYVSIAGYALWFIPSATPFEGGGEASFAALPPREFLDHRAHDARPLADPPLLFADPRASVSTNTRVTRLLPPLLMGEGPEPEIGWGELRLASSARRERRTISAERLAQGLLIGRYERCGVMVAEDHRISRVHLLLVRIGADVWAIDTASTNGVRRDEGRFRAGVLRDVDNLMLGADVHLGWRRTQHPDA